MTSSPKKIYNIISCHGGTHQPTYPWPLEHDDLRPSPENSSHMHPGLSLDVEAFFQAQLD